MEIKVLQSVVYENVEAISSYWLMTLLTGFCSQGRVVPIAREQQKNLLKQGTNKAEAKIGARSEEKLEKFCIYHVINSLKETPSEVRLRNRVWNQCPNLHVSSCVFSCLWSNHSQLTNNIFDSCMLILRTHLNAKYYSYLTVYFCTLNIILDLWLSW